MEEVKPERVVVCSDSAAVLLFLESGSSRARPDLMYEVLYALHRVERGGSDVGFLWVPAHVGIMGIEGADQVAKEALKRDTVDVAIALSRYEHRSSIKMTVCTGTMKGEEGTFIISRGASMGETVQPGETTEESKS